MKNTKEFKEIDFERPSFLFKLSDSLMYLLGGAGFYNKFLNTIPLKGTEQVLDFGCGGGIASNIIIKNLSEGHLTCLEPSHFWMNRARTRLQRSKNISFIDKCIEDAELAENTFDIILIHHVLHDIHPEKRPEVVRQLSRILKPDGRINIREPIKKSHGIPYEEIRELFKDVDRKEVKFSIKTNKEYTGIYS